MFVNSSFLFFFYCWAAFHYMDILYFSVYQFSGYLDYFQFGAAMNNIAINFHVQVFEWTFLLGRFLGVELLIHIISVFNFLRNCRMFLKRLYNVTSPSVQCMRGGSSFSTLLPTGDFRCSSDCVVNLTVVLINIFLMSNDVKHLFIYLFAVCTSNLVKCLFKYFAHLKN